MNLISDPDEGLVHSELASQDYYHRFITNTVNSYLEKFKRPSHGSVGHLAPQNFCLLHLKECLQFSNTFKMSSATNFCWSEQSWCALSLSLKLVFFFIFIITLCPIIKKKWTIFHRIDCNSTIDDLYDCGHTATFINFIDLFANELQLWERNYNLGNFSPICDFVLNMVHLALK